MSEYGREKNIFSRNFGHKMSNLDKKNLHLVLFNSNFLDSLTTRSCGGVRPIGGNLLVLTFGADVGGGGGG